MSTLPKNLVIDRGYLMVRIMFRGRIHIKSFGPDNSTVRLLAAKYAADTKLAMRMGTFNIVKELPSIKFDQAANIFISIWEKEKNAEGQLKHSKAGIYTCKLFLNNSLKPYFSKFYVEDIKPMDVENYRTYRMKTVSPTTANREQGVLSSVFGHLSDWIKLEKIEAFKLP